MTVVMDDFPALLRRIEKIRRKVDMAQGALDQLLRRLEKEFNCSSIEDGQAQLDKMNKQLNVLFKKYVEFRKKFDEEYKDLLEGLKPGGD